MAGSPNRYGWRRDLPDHRDRYYTAPFDLLEALPTRVDLREQCPPVYDQGNLGACTANALAALLEFDELRAGNPEPWTPSRLFLYYNERALEDTTAVDAGATLRDGIKVAVRLGVCPEAMWPYDVARFATRPPQRCYAEAVRDRISAYLRIPQTLLQLKTRLAEGFPFAFGFTAYSSLETRQVAKTGHIPLPQAQDSSIGGHAVCAVGYDDADGMVIIRNSWGTGWGDGGYGYMPYAYVNDAGLAADFWTVRSAPGGPPLA